MSSNTDFLDRPYPYKKNGLNVVCGYENDILSSDMNRKTMSLLGDTQRKSWIVSAPQSPNFFVKNSDSKLVLKAPFSFCIGGAYIEMESDLISTNIINTNDWAYLYFSHKDATVEVKISSTKPETTNDELLLGQLNSEGVLVEEERLRVPTFCSNKIITDEAMLENEDFLKTLRCGDLILLV